MTIYRGSNQRITEYHSWVALCLGLKIQSYVELGCGSSWEQSQAGIKVVTVDVLPNGLGGIHHIQGDSHSLESLHKALEYLGGQPECVFIDADHSYDAVRQDFDVWYPAATRLIGFHDIKMPEVGRFWREVSREYPSIELVSRDAASANQWQHGGGSNGDLDVGGIGVIFKEQLW